jgi:acetoin utilization protein AcuB
MNVARYMHTDPVTVRTDAPLSEVKQVMEEKGFSLLLVVNAENDLAGFITKGALKGVTDWNLPVEKTCFEARFAVSPGDTVEKAALILIENQLVLLPVVDEGRLVGVISQSEILRALARALGIGLEGTRITVRLPHTSDEKAVYRVLDTLNQHDVQLVSVAQGEREEAYQQVILRVQGITDKEELRAKLEALLRNHHADNQDKDTSKD